VPLLPKPEETIEIPKLITTPRNIDKMTSINIIQYSFYFFNTFFEKDILKVQYEISVFLCKSLCMEHFQTNV